MKKIIKRILKILNSETTFIVIMFIPAVLVCIFLSPLYFLSQLEEWSSE